MRGGWRTRVALAAVAAAMAAAWPGASGRAPSAQIPARLTPPPGRVTLALPGRSAGAPALAVGGPVVAVAWAAGDGTGADAAVAISRDRGRTFAHPVRVNDRPGTVRATPESGPRVAVGPVPAGGTDPVVVVAWVGREPESTIRWAISRDGGRTFAPSARVEGTGATGNRGWAALALTAAGVPMAVWLDHRGVEPMAAGGSHQHHDAPAGAATPAEKAASAATAVARAQQSALYLAVGSAAPRLLTPGVCYCCKTALAVGPGRRVAVAWRHVYEGSVRDIAFTRSRDGGRTFDAPARLSADGWMLDGCPEDGPAAAFDPRGTLHAAWATVVTVPREHKAVFYAAVPERGARSPRTQVSPVGQFAAHASVAVAATGRPVVAWESVGPTRGVWMVTAGRDGRFGRAARVSGDADATYPAVAAVGGDLVVAWLEREYADTRVAVQTFAGDGSGTVVP